MLVVCLTLFLCLCALVAGSKGNPNPAMLKGKTAKMRVMLSHSLTREQKGYRKSYTPDFASVFESHSKPINNIDDGGVRGAQLYARKHGTGLWLLLQSLPHDETSIPLSASINEGGISAENARLDMDKWVAAKVFGTGMGDPVVLNHVRNSLPPLKKLKPQQIQFGYRVADEDIGAIERSMVNGMPPTRKIFSGMPAAAQITIEDALTDNTTKNIAQVLKNPESIHSIRQRDSLQDIISFNKRIEEYARTLLIHNVSKILICADGSANFNDAGCVLAAGGVAVTAVYSDHPEMDTPVVDAQNKSISMYLRVSDMECMTTTPFDAELSSGLAGLVVTKLLLHHYSRLQRTIQGIPTGQYIDYSISPEGSSESSAARVATAVLPSPASPLSVELYSDSRSYCRALRTDLSADLSVRREHNRLQVWQLATALHRSMTDSNVVGNNDSMEGSSCDATVSWTAGHPERTHTNVSSWSATQLGMWAADHLAKSHTSPNTATTTISDHSTGVSSDGAVLARDLADHHKIPALCVLQLSKALLSEPY